MRHKMLVFNFLALIACVLTEDQVTLHPLQRKDILTDSCRDSGIFCLVKEEKQPSEDRWRLQVHGLFNTCLPPSVNVFSKITKSGNVSCFDVSMRTITLYNTRGKTYCFQFQPDEPMIEFFEFTINHNASLVYSNDVELIPGDAGITLHAYHNSSELNYNVLEVTVESIEYRDQHNVTCRLDNIAYRKLASQKNEALSNPTFAVNGIWNDSCDFTTSISGSEGNWWQVDLLNTSNVRRAKIYIRISRGADLKQVSYLGSNYASPNTDPSNDSESWDFLKYHHETFNSMTVEDFNPSVQLRHFAIFTTATSVLLLREVMLFEEPTVVVTKKGLVVRCPIGSLRFGSSYKVSVKAIFTDLKASPVQRFSPILSLSVPMAPTIQSVSASALSSGERRLQCKVKLSYPENTYCDQLHIECYSTERRLPCSPPALSFPCEKEVKYVVREASNSKYYLSAKVKSGPEKFSSPHTYSFQASGIFIKSGKTGSSAESLTKTWKQNGHCGWLFTFAPGAILYVLG